MAYTAVKTPQSLYVCTDCGAVVSDKSTHDKWHDFVVETLAQGSSAYGLMIRKYK